MSVPTVKVEEIRDAAQELADFADELLGLREDDTADREDKAQANDDFEQGIRDLLRVLPKKAIQDHVIEAVS